MKDKENIELNTLRVEILKKLIYLDDKNHVGKILQFIDEMEDKNV